MSDDEGDPAFIRDFGRIVDHKIQILLEAKKSIEHERAHIARWLIASLFAINSGGLVFLGDTSLALTWSNNYATVALIAGLIFAMLNAYLIRVYAIRQISPIIDMISYLTTISSRKDENEQSMKELRLASEKAIWGSWNAPIAGWISMVAFIIGIGFTGHMVATELHFKSTEARRR